MFLLIITSVSGVHQPVNGRTAQRDISHRLGTRQREEKNPREDRVSTVNGESSSLRSYYLSSLLSLLPTYHWESVPAGSSLAPLRMWDQILPMCIPLVLWKWSSDHQMWGSEDPQRQMLFWKEKKINKNKKSPQSIRKPWMLTTKSQLFRFQELICYLSQKLCRAVKEHILPLTDQLKPPAMEIFYRMLCPQHCQLALIHTHTNKCSKCQTYEKSVLCNGILKLLPARGGRYVLQSLEGRFFI